MFDLKKTVYSKYHGTMPCKTHWFKDNRSRQVTSFYSSVIVPQQYDLYSVGDFLIQYFYTNFI